MNGIMFKPDIWIAKKKVLEQLGFAVTRRLGGLKELNQEPDKWELIQWKYKMTGKITTGFFFRKNDGKEIVVHPRYHIGETVYIKEAWATEKQYDNLKPSEIPNTAKIFYVNDGVGEWPIELIIGRLRSPLFMPAWAARDFIQFTDIRPELFRLAQMIPQELELEGGEPALKYLKEYDGKWLWRDEFRRVEK